MAATLRVLSWNVNGLRSCTRKGFASWLADCGADVLGVQEVRALPEELDPEVGTPKHFHTHFAPAERRGYSGVGVFSRQAPDRVESSLGEDRFDVEGRFQLARFGKLAIANVYFPKGSGNARDNSRVPYKLDFYQAVFERLQRLRRGGARVLVMGDFNTAHHEIDLARAKDNVKNSGFLPEERAELDRWIAAGWSDTFRSFEQGSEHYSWWSQRGGARARNVGWRIDYVFASKSALPFLKSAFILPDVMGSDHCPVGVELDPAIIGTR